MHAPSSSPAVSTTVFSRSPRPLRGPCTAPPSTRTGGGERGGSAPLSRPHTGLPGPARETTGGQRLQLSRRELGAPGRWESPAVATTTVAAPGARGRAPRLLPPPPPGTHRAEAAGGGGAPGPRTRLQAPCPLRASAARCPGPSRPGSRRGASPAAAAASVAASAPRRGRRASLPQAVAGGGTGCISPGYIAGPESRRGGVGNAEPAELPAPHVRGGRRGREGGDGEEGVWIARFTPTDLHLPRCRRPPPAAARAPPPARPAGTQPCLSRQHRGPAARPARGSREREAAGPGERLCKRILCSAAGPPPPRRCTAREAATRRRRPDVQRTPSSSARAEPSSSVRCALPQSPERG